jgi:hypothetical protein
MHDTCVLPALFLCWTVPHASRSPSIAISNSLLFLQGPVVMLVLRGVGGENTSEKSLLYYNYYINSL